MIKFTLFLLAFFSASFILQGTKAQDLTCRFDYYSVDLIGIGVRLLTYVLSQAEPSTNILREPYFPLDQFTLTGYCDCQLYLYSQGEFGGCYIRSEESYDGSVHRYVDDIWTRPGYPLSFVLECSF